MWSREGTRELLLRLLPPDDPERDSLRRDLVDDWVQVALASPPMLRLVHLGHARELAQRHNLEGLIGDLDHLHQATPEPEMKELSAEFDLPREQLDALRGQFERVTTADDLLQALVGQRFVGRTNYDVRDELLDLQIKSPLQFLIPTQVIHGTNAVVWSASSPEEIFDLKVIQHETYGASAIAFILLDTINRAGVLDRVDPADAATPTGCVDSGLTDELCIALRLWIDGYVRAAMCALLPEVERVVRQLARAMGMVTIRPQRGAKAGGYKTLGTVLADLAAVFAEVGEPAATLAGVVRWWRIALVEPLGLNLRNEYLHGLRHEPQAWDFVVLLHVVAQLRCIKIPNRDDSGH